MGWGGKWVWGWRWVGSLGGYNNTIKMESLQPKRTTSHSCSHDEGDVGEGGRDGYPCDRQAALDKLNVSLCDGRDQVEKELESIRDVRTSDWSYQI